MIMHYHYFFFANAPMSVLDIQISQKRYTDFCFVLHPDIGALAKKSNDNALSLVLKITNE